MARKLAVIMHAMWTDGTCYVGDAAASASARAARTARKDGKLPGRPGKSVRPTASMLRAVILTVANWTMELRHGG